MDCSPAGSFVGFSRQQYWSGLPFPSPGDLPNLGIGPMSPIFPALAGGFFTTGPPFNQPLLPDSFLLVFGVKAGSFSHPLIVSPPVPPRGPPLLLPVGCQELVFL